MPMLLLLGLPALLCAPLHAETSQESYYHIFEDMHTFSTFYPRTENSPGEKATLRHIERRLENLGVSYRRYGLDTYEGFHSFSSTIEVEITGRSEETIYYLFPLNHPPGAAVHESNAAGLALALSLIERLSETTPPLGLKILFLGAETGEEPEEQLGSRAFLQNFSPENPVAFLYIDIDKLPARLSVEPAGTGMVAPAWMLQHLHESLYKSRTPYRMSPARFQIHRLGINDRPTPIDSYLREGFPTIYIGGSPTGAEEALPLPFSTLENFLLDFSLEFSDSHLPQRWDTHYFFLKLNEYLLLIGEVYYVVLILLLLAVTLLYPFVRSKRFIKYMRSIGRHIFTVPILFAFMLLFLYLSTLLLERIMEYRGIPSLWRIDPPLFLALKVSAAAVLFSLSQHIFSLTNLRRLRGSFYSASALLFLLFDIVLLSTVDISLALYGVWIFFFSFLFSSSRSRIMKLLYLLLAFSLAAVLLVRIFWEPHYEAIRLILLSKGKGNLMIALNLLPFMLMLLRLRMLFHHPNPRITRTLILGTDFILLFLVTALTWHILSFQPYSEGSKQPLMLSEQISVDERNRTMEIKSPADFGGLTALGADFRVEPPKEDSSYIERLPYREGYLETSIEQRNFLGRTITRLTVDTKHPPRKINLVLKSEEAILLYDCSFPVTYSTDRRSLRIHIGRNPPVPLDVSFTVPGDFTGTLSLQSLYTEAPYELVLPVERFDIDYRMEVTSSYYLSGGPVGEEEG